MKKDHWDYWGEIIEEYRNEKRAKREKVYNEIGNWLLVVAGALLLVYCVLY